MGKLKIEHGASKVQWTLLKTNIEESLANDLDLMCQWSNNDRKYVVNELLRFALEQAEEFQTYKSQRDSSPQQPNASPNSSIAAPKTSAGKPDSTGTISAARS